MSESIPKVGIGISYIDMEHKVGKLVNPLKCRCRGKSILADIETGLSFSCPNCDYPIKVPLKDKDQNENFTGVICNKCKLSYSLQYKVNKNEQKRD